MEQHRDKLELHVPVDADQDLIVAISVVKGATVSRKPVIAHFRTEGDIGVRSVVYSPCQREEVACKPAEVGISPAWCAAYARTIMVAKPLKPKASFYGFV